MGAPLAPFNFRRLRRAAAARHVSGLGQPGQPPAGPPLFAPFNNLDPLEQLTEQDEGLEVNLSQDPGHKTRPDLPPWIYPPVNFENIDQINYALVPAIGSTVTIISYVVPPGRNGIINKVACNFVGGGWIEGSGDAIWRILVDGSPPPGAVSYDSILASLGGPAQPTGIAGFRIFENQVLTLVGFNNPAGASGGVIVAGQRFGARFTGYNYPREIEEADIWI